MIRPAGRCYRDQIFEGIESCVDALRATDDDMRRAIAAALATP
jgi:hypothetical protein